YVLMAPICMLHEIFPPEEVLNPAAEIGYWLHGLTLAQRWRERLGLDRNPDWDRVISKMAALPIHDGVYIGHENAPDTFTAYNTNHPAMLLNYGMLPGRGVDPEIMRRTLHRVWDEWRWEHTWGWDFPVVAMCAARLGEPELAVDSLLLETPKNTYLANGHNRQGDSLPVYLPGNGALLLAVAMMAAGWEGGPGGHAPGFPSQSWTVKAEGLHALL
ncbi:MAG: glycoside hydrolase family 65, partial [Dehalococcoidia bacterium]